MKIKKFNENFEGNVLEGNDKMQNLKKLLIEVYDDALEIGLSLDADNPIDIGKHDFDNYWDMYGDQLIQKFGLLEKETAKQQGNIK